MTHVNQKKQQIQSLPYTKTSNLAGELELFVGLPVMLTTNIAVELQLTNGAFGTISRIGIQKKNTLKREGDLYILDTVPDYVIVKFHGVNIPQLSHLGEGEVPIFPIKATFQYRFPGTKTYANIYRYQLPLVASYSYTSYKSQNKTLDAVVADLLPPHGIPIEPSFAYVPLSRVRSLQDLIILRPFPITVLQGRRPDDLIAQDKRFNEMDKMTQNYNNTK